MTSRYGNNYATTSSQGIFSEDKKPPHRDSKTKKPRHDIDCLDYKFKILKHTSGVHTVRLFKYV